jgi:hypothetical protein
MGSAVSRMLVTFVLVAITESSHSAQEQDKPVDNDTLAQTVKELQAMAKADRGDRLTAQVALHKKWKDSKQFQAAIKTIANGKADVGDAERFFAASLVAGFGYPSSIGPNSIEGYRLGWYLEWQNVGGSPDYGPEARRFRVEERLKNLQVTVKPLPGASQTFQEIVWRIIQDYDLAFELRDGDTFAIKTKPKKAK